MEEIQIKIKMTSNAQVYTVKVAKNDTILKLKEECEKETKIPPKSQNLVYKGRILANEKLISNTNTNNNTNTNTNTNTNPNTNNNAGNNQNPFMGMGGQMPDLSSLLGNIDPNQINNMMQSMGGLGGLGGLGGMNQQAIGQLLSNPMYMQMMNSMLQNPEMIQMALNSPQMRQLAQNNPQMQAILNNPQLMQQMLNPQTLQMMSNLFSGMANQNQNNQSQNSNQGTGTNPLGGLDFNQMLQNLQGLEGLGDLGGLGGMGNMAPNNTGNDANNDANVDYKEKYKDQLAQLKDMGFINEEANIQVLKQCSGNVQFAIERLLNMLG